MQTKAMIVREFDQVNVGTTMQERAVAFPTNARLYYRTQEMLVKAAQNRGVRLRQS